MNTVNTLARPGTSRTQTSGTAEETRERPHTAQPGAPAGPQPPAAPASTTAAARKRDADGMAVASFVMGLTGLLVFNVLLGPGALVLAGLALMRGTERRGRAWFGLTLGVADLVVLAAVAAADQSFSWSLTG